MEEERKFVCKYCNKKYPCGKSLGGHIRTHMTTTSHSSNQIRRINNVDDDNDGGRKRKRDLVSEQQVSASENPIYGLRENPKKTTRFVHSNVASSQQERFCKECGKGFLSLKALCGHMACHSEKDKQKLVMDSQSDTETSSQNHNPRRSKRMRFKTTTLDSNSNNNSSVSEVEQEQEEVARCLMLLSKDTNYKGRSFVFPTESSDNNSVVLEAKSPSNNGFEIVEEKKKKKKNKVVCSDNSDSGYLRNGPKKLDSDVSIVGFQEFKTPKVEVRSEYDAESRKKMMMLKKNRGKSRITEPRKLFLDEENYDSLSQNNPIGVSWKKKTPNANDFSPNEEGSWKQDNFNSEKLLNNGSYDDDSSANDDESSTDTDTDTDTDSYPASPPKPHSSNGKSKSKKKKLKSKKSRDHECPICYKIFRSGQALGGHKRSHFVGGSEENNNTVVIKQDSPPVVPCLIDLNLPAPEDD